MPGTMAEAGELIQAYIDRPIREAGAGV